MQNRPPAAAAAAAAVATVPAPSMEVPLETLEALAGWFAESLSPDPAARAAAEQSLLAAAAAPSGHDLRSRIAAAVHCQNLLRRRWPPSPTLDDSHPGDHLVESAGLRIKIHFLALLLALAAATRDLEGVNSLLVAAVGLFGRFRNAFSDDAFRFDLQSCLDSFAAQLLEVFLSTSRSLHSAAVHPNPLELRPVFECLRLCCNVFYSLNSVGLPEFFVDHMREWMSEFYTFLTTVYPPALEADGAPDALRAATCDNLQLYMEKYEEQFRAFPKKFVEAVQGLLMTPSTSPSWTQLAVAAIRFLTTVAESVHHALFGSPEAMRQICDSVVVPNVWLREEDEELFEGNWVEYVRRDAEGGDGDRLRRTACRLLRGLAANYREEVGALVSGQVQRMLAAYAADRANNWKEKDAAIYLVIALMQKLGAAGGGSLAVDMESFFASAILPELQGADWQSQPMLKASVLKFLKEFREQIPKATALALMPSVMRFLTHGSNVVHSYASIFIESLLCIKDVVPIAGANALTRTPRYVATDINPFAQLIVQSLCNALSFPDSHENPYVMKCLMRVLGVANVSGQPMSACVARLAGILNEVCNNPKNPDFNHYLFEAVAAAIGRAGEQDPSLLPMFEASIVPVLQRILVKDISEFWPYAFQIFAQLVGLSRLPLSHDYMQLFSVLLTSTTWDRPPCIPALVRLLGAFLRKIPNELNQEGRLPNIIVLFRRLLPRNSTEDSAFYVLNTLVENFGYEMINPYINEMWSSLFTHLEKWQTVKFVNSLVVFMSLVLVRYGPDVLVNSIAAFQQNIFGQILSRFWIPNLKLIRGAADAAIQQNNFGEFLSRFWIPNLKLIGGAADVKLTAVASTRLLCESPVLLDPAAAELWGKMLDSIITLLTRPDQGGAQQLQDDAVDTPESQKTSGYSVSSVRLHYAGRSEKDLLNEVKDPKQFLVSSLARVCAQSPGRFGPIIEQYVDPANKNALFQLCSTYNYTILQEIIKVVPEDRG